MLLPGTLAACDVCGCTSMNMGLGNWAIAGQSTLGWRYTYRSFSGPGFTDYYHQNELWGVYALGSRWQFSAQLPLVYAQRDFSDNQSQHLQGLGDASAMVHYQVLAKVWGQSAHTLWLGTGLNLPTGRYRDPNNEIQGADFQLGTASLDYQSQMLYRINFRSYILLFQGAYLYNTRNRYSYTFGDQAQLSLRAGHSWEGQVLQALFYGGMAWSYFGQDINQRNFYQYGTGGEAWQANLGAQLFWQNWWLGLEWQPNVYHHSRSAYKPQQQWQINLNYRFGS